MTPTLRRAAARGVALTLFGALGFSVAGGLKRYVANRRECARLERKVVEAEASLARKRALLGLAQEDESLLEAEARRQLGLIGEDEVEFRFTPASDGGPEKMDAADRNS